MLVATCRKLLVVLNLSFLLFFFPPFFLLTSTLQLMIHYCHRNTQLVTYILLICVQPLIDCIL